MKFANHILACLFIFGLIGCDTSSEDNSFTDSYEFEDNGCSTDKHTFVASNEADLLSQLCQALENNELNNFCALEMRLRTYQQRCQD